MSTILIVWFVDCLVCLAFQVPLNLLMHYYLKRHFFLTTKVILELALHFIAIQLCRSLKVIYFT